MTPPEGRGNLCKKCGRCCWAKAILGDKIYYTDIPCPHLDLETNLCSVYKERFKVNPDCLSIEDGIRLGVFPADCPYVADISDYRPPHLDCDREEMGKLYRWADDQEPD